MTLISFTYGNKALFPCSKYYYRCTKMKVIITNKFLHMFSILAFVWLMQVFRMLILHVLECYPGLLCMNVVVVQTAYHKCMQLSP